MNGWVCSEGLSKEQEFAVSHIDDWFTSKRRADHYRLGGVAGCGKSYIIPRIVGKLGLNECQVAVVAYTGKAAFVLKNKHKIPSSTIHSLIYKSKTIIDKDTGEEILVFEKRKRLPYQYKLIIVDESSMVNEDIHYDLLSYRVPVLYIGDFFQLPPVKSNFNLMDEGNLDYKLTTIHRQAEDSDIINISMKIRDGYNIPFGSYGSVNKKTEKNIKVEDLLDYDQIICGRNDTRIYLNETIRKMKGFSGLPKRTEKLVITRHNYNFGVVNGQQVVLTDDSVKLSKRKLNVSYVNEYDMRDAVKMILSKTYNHPFSMVPFLNGLKEDYREKKRLVFADFGYVMTTHKSQGSEWDDVFFYDDGFWVNKGLDRLRWLYTSVTRASEKLLWVSV